MRRFILPLFTTLLMLVSLTGQAQSPPGINYQGVARNPDGKPLAQKDIAIRIKILHDGGNSEVEYTEVHSVKTNSFGLFTLVIGGGDPILGTFPQINWAVGTKWLLVEMDPDGGNSFQLMGSQQFMSVPYAFYAKHSSSSLTPGQGISISNNVVTNTGDSDNNPQNEMNLNFALVGKKLQITDGAGTKEADLSGLIPAGSTPQELSLNANELAISDGNTVDLTKYLDNTDEQQLSLVSNQLAISGGNSVNLSTYLDNTDSQNLGLSGTTLSISGGTGVNLAPFKQDLSIVASGTQRTVNIVNGTGVTFDVADNDNSATNEIQDLARSGNILTLSGDATPVDLTPYLDNTDSQSLGLTGANLSITGGNTVNLAGLLDNTDSQDLSLNAATHSLSLTGDPTPVNLAAYMDNTDDQNLSMLTSGDNRTLSIENGNGVTFSIADGDANSVNELQSLTYNAGTKVLSISSGNNVTITETQNLNQVLIQGNDANGQKITNLAAPTASTDAATKQYVDNADAIINARISANYAFKTGFNYSNLLAIGNDIAVPLGAPEAFDDFNVVNTASFTASVAGTYMFFVDGSISTLIGGPSISVLYNGTKYPVAIASNNRYNSTYMFRLTAGQTVSIVGDGLGVGATISGSFFGHKLP